MTSSYSLVPVPVPVADQLAVQSFLDEISDYLQAYVMRREQLHNFKEVIGAEWSDWDTERTGRELGTDVMG